MTRSPSNTCLHSIFNQCPSTQVKKKPGFGQSEGRPQLMSPPPPPSPTMGDFIPRFLRGARLDPCCMLSGPGVGPPRLSFAGQRPLRPCFSKKTWWVGSGAI